MAMVHFEELLEKLGVLVFLDKLNFAD